MTVVLTAGLSACSDFRRAIGEGKSAPDEFQVVVRAPLSLPPGFGDNPEDIVKSSQTSGVNAQASTANLLGSQTVEGSESAVCLIFPAFLMISAPRSMKKPMAFSWKSGCHCKRCLAAFLMWGQFSIKWPKICGFAKRVLPDKHQPKAAPRPLIQQAINRLPSIRPPLWPLSANFPTG